MVISASQISIRKKGSLAGFDLEPTMHQLSVYTTGLCCAHFVYSSMNEKSYTAILLRSAIRGHDLSDIFHRVRYDK